MTHEHSPFEHHHEEREDLWDKVVTYGSLITAALFITYLIGRTILTV